MARAQNHSTRQGNKTSRPPRQQQPTPTPPPVDDNTINHSMEENIIAGSEEGEHEEDHMLNERQNVDRLTSSQTTTTATKLSKTTAIIVDGFMKSQLNRRGCTWEPQTTTYYNNNHDDTYTTNIFTKTKIPDDRRQMARVLEALDELAKELEAFTSNVLNEQFARIVSLLDDLHPQGARDAFNRIADELFAGGIKWSHIVTLLVFGVELAYNRLENENEDMVNHITKWMSNYINHHLSDWINTHGGWEGIRSLVQERDPSSDEDNNRTLKIFYGLAATAALLGATVLCLKLHP